MRSNNIINYSFPFKFFNDSVNVNAIQNRNKLMKSFMKKRLYNIYKCCINDLIKM